ncbi:hypothetical protein B296_00047583 [Ensete ventricosum]|uniref:Uncharacterized protein n=1 Tax=Ensete ventricosum TaxID=4639 RepID=A0A426X574_ENSVE|nr:hypothetical protein B296_00047583 [Ensete ventricosum]
MIGAMELQLADGPRSILSIGPAFGRCSGISLKFTRRFAEGIGKLAWNTLGDRRKKTGRLAAIMPEVIGLAGTGRLNRLYPGIWVLSVVDPPKTSE